MKNNLFSIDFLDRVSEQRNNMIWIDAELKSSTSKIIPIWNSMIFCKNDLNLTPVFLTHKDLAHYKTGSDSSVLLGVYNKETYFAINIESDEYMSGLCVSKHAEFVDLKKAAPLYQYQDFALLSLARFMAIWSTTHQFCGKCGGKTTSVQAGNLRVCKNNHCKQQYFPSMDPAIIVLVSHDNKCLLGRQPIWPKGMYSTIAGFVEPGETIEDAVSREVYEETGIIIEKIEYRASQAWLFPSSLMLGFTARAKNIELRIAENELEDARWFTREEIKNQLDQETFKLPSLVSIAYNLIKLWYDKDNVGKLNPM